MYSHKSNLVKTLACHVDISTKGYATWNQLWSLLNFQKGFKSLELKTLYHHFSWVFNVQKSVTGEKKF